MIKVKNTKLGFFRKLQYSTTKISKYPEMLKEGVFSAIKYYTIVILIFAVIYSIPVAISLTSIYKEGYTYMENTLPDVEFSENILEAGEDVIYLSHDIVSIYLGGSVIVDTSAIEENLTEYKTRFGSNLRIYYVKR